MNRGNIDKAGFYKTNLQFINGERVLIRLQVGTFYRLNLSGFLIPLKINKLYSERYLSGCKSRTFFNKTNFLLKFNNNFL